MLERTVVALSVMAGLLPGAAMAAPAHPSARTFSLASATTAVERLQAQALARMSSSPQLVSIALRAAGRSPYPISNSAAVGAVALDSVLMPAGDFNHDGVRDVLDVRYHSVGSAAERVAIFARNGRTGALLWSKTVPGVTGHIVMPEAQPIGLDGGPGLLLVDTGTSSKNRVLTVTVRLTALDKHGNKLWSHFESGTLDNSAAEHHMPLPIDFGTYESPKVPDLLLARLDAPGGKDPSATLTPLRVRGTDGGVVQLGASVTSPVGAPGITSVPDISGDSLADVVLVVPGSGDGTGVYARHGVDGSPIWSTTSLMLYAGAVATPVGDVHDSATGVYAAPDIAVSSGPPTGGLGLPLPLPDPTAPPAHGNVSLLDGATGSTVWTKQGDFAYGVQKAGSPLVPATGVWQTDVTSDSTKTTATLTLTMYDDSGNAVNTTTFKATTPTDPNGTATALSDVEAVGDLEPDGSIDGVVLIVVSSGNNSAVRLTYFRGVDGSPLHAGAAVPLGGATTGHGEDLVVAKATPRTGMTITVERSADNSVLFSRHIARTAGLSVADALGTPLHKSVCADVLVSGEGPDHAASAVLSGVGGVDWMVRFEPGSTTPGTVYRPSTPPRQPICAAPATTVSA